MTPITVYKCDHEGHEVWHYSGDVLARGQTWVQLEARFNRPDRDLGYAIFRLNDRFVEWFYNDRWYNIFEIHAVEDDHLKGWYCNVTRPATLAPDTIRSDDLALDLWVSPSGELLTLDEDEFAALNLNMLTREHALQALDELRRMAVERIAPFDQIDPAGS